MNDLEKINAVKKLGGWERMVIFSGVLLTVPLFALLGTAIYALVADRPDAHMGVLLSIVSLLVLWAIVWGMLWIVSGFREGGGNNLVDTSANELEALRQENERLRRQLAELTQTKR
jgi:hypothetical protein